jgi:hypothetical protein
MMTPIEQKALQYSTELNSDPFQLQEFCRWIPLVEDMDRFINMSIREGAAGLLYTNLIKSDSLGILGGSQRKKLSSWYYLTARNNLKRMYDLKRLLPQFAQHHAQVVLLKGIALLQQVYKDVGLRAMTDIDLWISQKDNRKITRVLIDNHFIRDPLYPNTFRKGITTIDLHTDILGSDRIRRRTSLLKQTAENLYQNTRVLNFEGVKTLCLGRYDQLLFLCLHALKHNVDQLIWLLDIKNLTVNWKDSDWQTLLRRGKEVGQEKSIAGILFLLKHQFAYPQSPAAILLKASQKLTHLEKRILKNRIKRGALPDWAPLIFFSTEVGLKDRCLLTLETLFPRPDILRQVFNNFPDLNVWQLYVMRFFQLISRALALLLKK